MESIYVTFRSVTFAQRGEEALRRAGIGCSLQRTPRWMEERGCGYCLGLRQRDGSAGVQILRKKQVPFRKVYLRRDDGNIQEVEL